METFVLNTDLLPLQIREKFHVPTVSVQEKDGAVVLVPIKEGSGLKGIAANSNLTVDKFLAYKRADKELDSRMKI